MLVRPKGGRDSVGVSVIDGAVLLPILGSTGDNDDDIETDERPSGDTWPEAGATRIAGRRLVFMAVVVVCPSSSAKSDRRVSSTPCTPR